MTTPQRVAAKFLLTDPTAPVQLEPFIGIFHRFIQQGVLDGLLVDVADYSHVPNGPGIVLIGHDVDYGLDLVGGQAGLLTLRKRYSGLSTAEVVSDTLKKGLAAVAAIEAEPKAKVVFDTSAVTIELFDRLRAPNSDDAFEARRKEIEPVADALYGAGAHEISRAHGEDARKALSLRVAGSAADTASLLSRLP
jgi:hypothetical protein